MKRKFDINDFTEMHVMHCDTKEKAESFLELLNSYGLKWRGDNSYLESTNFEDYAEQTCYRFLAGSYGDYELYSLNHKYTILEFDDFDFSHLDEPFEEDEEFCNYIDGFQVTK